MKEPLTIEKVNEDKMTAIDCVKYYRPEWKDEWCDYYAWNETCFPMSPTTFLQQLNDQLNKPIESENDNQSH